MNETISTSAPSTGTSFELTWKDYLQLGMNGILILISLGKQLLNNKKHSLQNLIKTNVPAELKASQYE